MAEVVQKMKILGTITVISNITFIIFCVFMGFNVFYETLGIDLIINNICLMLTFAKFKSIYHKCCRVCIIIAPKPSHIPHIDPVFSNANFTPPIKSENSNIETKETQDSNTEDSIGDIIYDTNLNGTINSNNIPKQPSSLSKFTENLRNELKVQNNMDSNNIESKTANFNDITIETHKNHTKSRSIKSIFNLVLNIKDDDISTTNNNNKLRLQSPLICSQQLRDIGITL
mmetsp:Transcript_97792/g.119789  ORF Transcript_97792/g.119789 Transcript_97792/m.119789 type:complete len:229 (+) Transcript_97792:1-687(+)